MTYERKLPNGQWIEEKNIERFFDGIFHIESYLAARLKRDPMDTAEKIYQALDDGRAIKYDQDWYAEIRKTPAPRSAETTQRINKSIQDVYDQAEKQERWDREEY